MQTVTLGTRILMLHNPKAGSRSGAQAIASLRSQLVNRGFAVESVTDAGQLHRRAMESLESGDLRTVVAAGGDGTAAFAANHTPADCPITVLPLGTENLLAKYLGLSATDRSVADTIAAGRVERFDGGLVHRSDGSSRLFLLMLGCGFDADVIQRLHATRQGNITHRAYIKPIWEALRSYRYPELRVLYRDQSNQPYQGPLLGHWAFAFNTPSYAIGLGICPDANPGDGKLDVVLFRGGSLLHGLKHLLNVVLRRHRSSAQFRSVQARFLRIESATTVQFQVDGDPGGELPIEVEVLPGRLCLNVPPGWNPQRSALLGD